MDEPKATVTPITEAGKEVRPALPAPEPVPVVAAKPEAEIMLDLETMGLKPDAAIVQIGAVAFQGSYILQKFFISVDLQSSIDAGGSVTGSTVMWWLRQSQEARDALQHLVAPLHSALQQFTDWLNTFEVKNVWSNGANFDVVIMRSAYERLALECPWTYFQERCFRTIKMAANPIEGFEVPGLVEHRADDDALWQATYLVALRDQYKKLVRES